MTITMIKLPSTATVDENHSVVGMAVRNADGTDSTYCVGYCSPGNS